MPDHLRALPAPLVAQLRPPFPPEGQLPAGGGGGSPARGSPSRGARGLVSGLQVMSTEALGLMLAWELALAFRKRCPPRLQANASALLRQTAALPPALSAAFLHASLPGARSGAAELSELPPLERLLDNGSKHSASADTMRQAPRARASARACASALARALPACAARAPCGA